MAWNFPWTDEEVTGMGRALAASSSKEWGVIREEACREVRKALKRELYWQLEYPATAQRSVQDFVGNWDPRGEEILARLKNARLVLVESDFVRLTDDGRRALSDLRAAAS
jgi:hypothetical protein